MDTRYLQEKESNQKITFGLGLRRQRHQVTLDISYPLIKRVDMTFFLTSNPHKEVSEYILKVIQNFKDQDCYYETVPLQDHLLESLFSMCSFSAVSGSKMVSSLKATGSLQTYSTMDAIVFVMREGNQAIQSTEEAYFKLHGLSHRLYRPHELCLDGVFEHMPNVAWTKPYGPILVEDLDIMRFQSHIDNKDLWISHVDRFPYMTSYIVPKGVRIGLASQVRLGAYLSEGTTVMPSGYVNFNAGTLGKAMIEGRISSGVVVGDNTDIGGGASIMGTLSGGGKQVIRIGERCLIGANAGTGISLGDGCTVAAGTYITAGTKVSLYNENKQPVDLNNRIVSRGEHVFKAIELSGKDGMLLLRNSISGEVCCYPNTKHIALNSALHQND